MSGPPQGGANFPRLRELKSIDRYAIERFLKEAGARHVSDLRPHVDARVLRKMSKLLSDYNDRYKRPLDFTKMVEELKDLYITRKSKTVFAAIGGIKKVGRKFKDKKFRRYMRQVKIVIGALERDDDESRKAEASTLLLERIAKTAPKSLHLTYLRIRDRKMTPELAYAELEAYYDRKNPFEGCESTDFSSSDSDQSDSDSDTSDSDEDSDASSDSGSDSDSDGGKRRKHKKKSRGSKKSNRSKKKRTPVRRSKRIADKKKDKTSAVIALAELDAKEVHSETMQILEMCVLSGTCMGCQREPADVDHVCCQIEQQHIKGCFNCGGPHGFRNCTNLPLKPHLQRYMQNPIRPRRYPQQGNNKVQGYRQFQPQY